MLQQFLHDFGYFALFLGTFFEGETILVLAGFLAFREYMDINLVVVVAFFGSYAGDQLWYYMGRKHGRKLLARKPRWQLMGDKALEHIRKHPDIWVLSFRFVYGLRTVMPVAIGLSGYPPLRYLVLNGIGAAIWAAALGAAAYHFGAVLEGMLGSVKKYELWVLGALILLGFVLWLRRRFKNARIAREECAQARAREAADPVAAETPVEQTDRK
ncbi:MULTISPECIES: DedA family protein [Pseudomonas]|uniref:DedA family protein n=1 Tax=Pseudomonas TaxID=286 RepID=UPI001AE2B001|nr:MULTISPECIES: DedA family protein [unclassified Pseudomonas]MBP1126765.1 membrane protein DedA with SNARE-associated domain [Pseudomonas sp. PvP025]MDQ0400625.1 membrane protein DedA with SNARE-associated domain [Pseudomonas sp. PvP006]MEB0106791.1 DedA family protein [Pseudomonas sp. MH9.3]WPX77614.1 DedA family protein [Pseudomonas sp. MH9.3]